MSVRCCSRLVSCLIPLYSSSQCVWRGAKGLQREVKPWMWSAVQLQVGPQLGFGGSVSTVVGTGKRYEEVREGVCIVDCLENKCNRFIVICRCC